MEFFFVGQGCWKTIERLPELFNRVLITPEVPLSHVTALGAGRKGGSEIFLDCGAFSAWTRGKLVNAKEHARFVLDHLSLFRWVASLDVIPGFPGRAPTEAEVRQSAEASWKNYNILLDMGVPKKKIVPAFHAGEPIAILTRYLEDKPGRIGIGGIARMRDDRRVQELGHLFRSLGPTATGRGHFHAYGVSSTNSLLSFPFTSCDSSSWFLHGAYGDILWKAKRGRGLPTALAVTKDSGASTHMNALPKETLTSILEELKAVGISLQMLTEDTYARRLAGAYFMRKHIESLRTDGARLRPAFF
jgi:hypothetical protein